MFPIVTSVYHSLGLATLLESALIALYLRFLDALLYILDLFCRNIDREYFTPTNFITRGVLITRNILESKVLVITLSI